MCSFDPIFRLTSNEGVEVIVREDIPCVQIFTIAHTHNHKDSDFILTDLLST